MNIKESNDKNLPSLYKILFCSVGDISFTSAFDFAFFYPNSVNPEPHMHSKHEVHIVDRGEYILENLDGTVRQHCR